MLRNVSPRSRLRPVLWHYSTLWFVLYCVGKYYATSSTMLRPILRAAISSTMVTSGPATTISHSTMSRLRSTYAHGPILWVCPVQWLRRILSNSAPCRPSPSFYGMTSLDPMSSRKCGVQYYGSMDLWYVWSHPMSGSMICVVYPASSSTTDLWYVWSYPMSARSMMVWYVWLYPTSPRPAILRYARSYPMSASVLRPASAFYVFRPITSDFGLSASVCGPHSTVLGQHGAPLGGVEPRRAEVQTGGTHTPVFDIIVRSRRELPSYCVPDA